MNNVFKMAAIDQEDLTNLFVQYPIIVAYLYGSVAKNENGPLSDVDIAVFLDQNLSKSERFDLRLRLIIELASRLKTPQVDLVVMNDTPIYLQFEIIKTNQVIFCRDESARIEQEARIMSRYLDMKYYRDRYTQLLMQQISREGLR